MFVYLNLENSVKESYKLYFNILNIPEYIIIINETVLVCISMAKVDMSEFYDICGRHVHHSGKNYLKIYIH